MSARIARLGVVAIGLAFCSSAWAQPVACNPGSKQTNEVYAVRGEVHWLLIAPRPDGAKQLNNKATQALNRPQYMAIDSSTLVKEECTQNGWSRVQIVRPSWLTSHNGAFSGPNWTPVPRQTGH